MSFLNCSITNDTNNTFELNDEFLNLSTNILYSFIFLIGITANSIVIYVLLSTLCFNQNRESNNTNPQIENQPNGTTTNFKQKNNSSFKSRSANSSLRQKYIGSESKTEVLPKQNELGSEIQLKKSLLTKQYANNNYSEIIAPSSPVISLSYEKKFKKFDLFCLYVKRFFKENLSVTNFYLLNLAFSDLFYMLSIPILLCTIFYGRWIFNELFCRFYLASCYVFQCSSVFILIVLSVDRYLSVKYPFKVSAFRKPISARIIITSMWIISFILYSPVFYFSRVLETNEVVPTCSIDWPTDWNTTIFNNSKLLEKLFAFYNLFFVYTFFFNYLVPVIIIIILYTQILCLLHRKNISNLKKSKKKTRVTRMVLAIIVCYVICWTPYWAFQLYNYVVHNYKGSLDEIDEEERNEATILQDQILTILSHFSQVIAYMSSALNPIIYSYMSEAFKTNLKYSVASCCCCKISENLESEDIHEFELKKKNKNSLINRSTRFSIKKDENFKKRFANTEPILHEEKLETDSFQHNEQVSNKKDTAESSFDTSETKKKLSFKLSTKNEDNQKIVHKLEKSNGKYSTIDNRNDSITTFIYKKPKSNFAFNINFHPLSTKNSAIRKKISLINKQLMKNRKITSHEKLEIIDLKNEIHDNDSVTYQNS